MKILIYNLGFSLLFLAACSGGGSKEQPGSTIDSTAAKTEMSVPSQQNTAITALLGPYFTLKNALTNDDDKQASAAGKKLVAALISFDQTALKPKQSKTFIEIQDDAKEHGEHIQANVGNIAHQREHFEMLSIDMYDLVKLLGTSQTIYLDHCPMYNNKKGAIWLSELKDIKNPYMGKAMSNCGTVKEELK